MKQPIFAGDSITMRVIYQYIDQNNLNITFEETAGGVVEPHQIKITSKEYFTANAPQRNDEGAFVWPEKKSLLVSPWKNNTLYVIRIIRIDNSHGILITTTTIYYRLFYFFLNNRFIEGILSCVYPL